MELKKFIDSYDLPNVRKLGKFKGTTYYIEKDIPENEDIGVPIVIQEKSGKYSICTSDEALSVISIFGDNET